MVVGQLAVFLGDAVQVLANHVDDIEQNRRHRRGPLEASLAEVAEQTLGGVRDRLQPGKVEEAAGAFDGVEGSKDAVEGVAAGRVLLDRDQVAVELIQVLLTFHQEFLNRQIDLAHPTTPATSRR